MATMMKKQLAEAIKAARAGETEQAQQMLQELLKAQPRGRELTETLYWLTLLTPDPTTKRRYLAQILKVDPQHERAQQQLAKLPDAAAAPAPSPATPETRQCPTCGAPLYFSGDGRSLMCERCGYRQQRAAAPQANRIHELEAAIRFAQQLNRERDREAPFQQNLRVWLAAGLGAVKEGNGDEAYEYLAKVLQATQASEEERIEAWLGLSQICEDKAEKRLCLENVLSINPREHRARKEMAILEGRLQADQSFDPNQVNPAARKMEKTRAQQMTCPRCSGQMAYNPEHNSWHCRYCDYREVLAAGEKRALAEIGEQDFLAAMFSARGHRQPVAMRVFQCQGCAVEFILAPEMLSLTCPYCDSAYVTDAAATQDTVPPDALIPASISQNQAQQALNQWFKAHRVERPRLLHLTGVYLPAWTFDIHGHVGWSYEVYEQDISSEGNFQLSFNQGGRWVKREDSVLVSEDDHLVVASHKWPPALQKWVHEFDKATQVSYDPRYLANWPAERYQITLSDASLRARRDIITPIKKRYERIGLQTRNFRLARDNALLVESYKLILLPLWLGHYELEGKRYAVMVNGQSGKVRGLRPQGILSTFFSWLTGE